MIIRYSFQDGKTATFETEAHAIIIGRNPCQDRSVNLVLAPDDYVSHQHARLTFENGQYWVEDLDSANGTWINGVLIARKTRLGPGDRLRIGWTRLTIEADWEADADATDIGDDAPTTVSKSAGAGAGKDPVVKNIAPGDDRPAADADLKPAPADAQVPPVRKKGLAAAILERQEREAGGGDAAPSDTCEEGVRAPQRYQAEPDIEPAEEATPAPPARKMGLAASILAEQAAAESTGTDAADVDSAVEDRTVLRESRPPVAEPEPAPRESQAQPVRKTGLAASILARAEEASAGTEAATDAGRDEDRPAPSGKTPPGAVPAPDTAPNLEQLQILSDLSARIGAADSFHSLMAILKKNLPRMIPNAQRGAVLLPDERGKLLLKAHWPKGEHSVSMTWIKRAFEEKQAFIWTAPDEDAAEFDTPNSAYFYKVQSAIYVPLMVGGETLGVMYVDNYFMRDAFSRGELEMMKTLAGQVAQIVKQQVQGQADERDTDMQFVFARQFPPKIAAILAGKYNTQKVGGEKVDPATLLVSDVRNFTALSAQMDPDAVVRMINEMFDALVPIVFEYDGVVDKFVGDSVLAVFGSPEPDDQQWEKAVRAAMEMQNAIRMLGEGRRARRLPVFEIGISVHSGEVIHGFIGSRQRTEYTVIGDAVNKAARFCDGAGAGEVVISEPVFEQVYGFVDVVPKRIKTKHADVEPELKAYVVKGIRKMDTP